MMVTGFKTRQDVDMSLQSSSHLLETGGAKISWMALLAWVIPAVMQIALLEQSGEEPVKKN